MAAVADKILANLPRIFATVPRPQVGGALADAFGGELTRAENSLAAMMFAHWVDVADKDSATLTDLALIAALYGLAPRDDESIEGFRAHLKRYVRTFLEGTVTTKGILRIVAESLAMVIADDDAQIDTWWNRKPVSSLTTVVPSGDDAAALLLGVSSAWVRGSDARPAEFVGTVDLSSPVDLRGNSVLQLAVDGGPPASVDLATHLDPASAALDAIVAAFASIPTVKAEAREGHLVLRSSTTGASSSLRLDDVAGDASQALLGVAPHLYRGSPATHAKIIGAVDLPSTLDLTSRRYVRLAVDGTNYEVDCAANGALTAVTPDQIVQAITAQTTAGIASLQNSRLVLSSPTLGLAGTVAILVPTTGDATRLLLGDVSTQARGLDTAPARVTSTTDLSGGVDLSQRSVLKLAVDGMPAITVLCAGANPKKTLAGEIATAINAAAGRRVASQNGRAVTLTSQQSGPSGSIEFLNAPANDALDLIFGLGSRTATGSDSESASITGTPDLHAGVDLNALQRLQIAVDDGPPIVIDLAATGVGSAGIKPPAIVSAINNALGSSIASTDGAHLILRSSLRGRKSALAVKPIETLRVTPFVSRAFSTDEAANIVLGFFAGSADGSGGTPAVLIGTADLHDGLDLRITRFLRVALDGGAPVDIDCASASSRARIALLREIVQAINTQLRHPIASISNGKLVLVSVSSGAGSAVSIFPSAGDATQAIFGRGPGTVNGTDAPRLIFTGLAVLSKGVDLSAVSHVRLSIDGGAPVEVDCAGPNPAQTDALQIASRINGALGGSYASTDGTYLRLSSSATGAASTIAFLVPAASDATRKIFGIDAGRAYVGSNATPATLVSSRDLPSALDLSAIPFIRISIDGAPALLVDCRGSNAAKTTPAEIAARIDAAFPSPKAATATVNGARVAVTAKSVGTGSRITLTAAGDGDASALLLGSATLAKGSAATAAMLTGTVDLRSPVDLSTRPILRIAIDGDRPVDIDVSGAAPDRTLGDEVAQAINAQLPDSATIDASGHLILQSPTTGPASHVEVQPLRALEVIEYPATSVTFGPRSVKTGQTFDLDNDGAAEATVSFALNNAHGMAGAELINMTSGYRARVDVIVQSNQTLNVTVQDGRVTATLVDPTGAVTKVDPSRLIATPQMLNAAVPFKGPRRLGTRRPGDRPALALVDTLANNVVVLEGSGSADPAVYVWEADATVSTSPPVIAPGSTSDSAGAIELVGRLKSTGATGTLVDSKGATIANVRASGSVSFDNLNGLMVCAVGTWYPDASLLNVEVIARLFHVKIGAVEYPAVTLEPRIPARSLTALISASVPPPIFAHDFAPSAALGLPRGKTVWTVTQCSDSRFDSAYFDAAEFAGGVCNEPGIFDLSRFNELGDDTPAHRDRALAGGLTRFSPLPEVPPITVTATWQSHQPGAFTVNLPADLPPQFGARFNDAHFGTGTSTSERFTGLVLDPPDNPHAAAHDYIVKALPAAPGVGSALVYAQAVGSVPLGWEGQSVPFGPPRRRFLTGGRADRSAALYLQERGVPGAIAILAKQPGPHGNDISISVRYAGPGSFEVTVDFAPARFECARAIVYAGRVLQKGDDPMPVSRTATGPALPVGVLQAKAAGIQATVTRELT